MVKRCINQVIRASTLEPSYDKPFWFISTIKKEHLWSSIKQALTSHRFPPSEFPINFPPAMANDGHWWWLMVVSQDSLRGTRSYGWLLKLWLVDDNWWVPNILRTTHLWWYALLFNDVQNHYHWWAFVLKHSATISRAVGSTHCCHPQVSKAMWLWVKGTCAPYTNKQNSPVSALLLIFVDACNQNPAINHYLTMNYTNHELAVT